MCVLCSIASRKRRKSLVSKVNRQRACRSHFVPSNGRGITGFYRVYQSFLTIIHLLPHRKPKGIRSDERIPFVALSHRLLFAM